VVVRVAHVDVDRRELDLVLGDSPVPTGKRPSSSRANGTPASEGHGNRKSRRAKAAREGARKPDAPHPKRERPSIDKKKKKRKR
jgi:hypothetical protein